MSELREEHELWAGLLSHPKWKQLEEWAEEQKAHEQDDQDFVRSDGTHGRSSCRGRPAPADRPSTRT